MSLLEYFQNVSKYLLSAGEELYRVQLCTFPSSRVKAMIISDNLSVWLSVDFFFFPPVIFNLTQDTVENFASSL